MTSSGNNANSRPLAILSAPGSRGDVNPMIAIGRALSRRRIDVVISLAEPYAPLAEAAGLTPQSLISQQRFDQLLDVPEVWKPVSGIRAILRDAAGEFLRPHFELISRLKRPGRTVLVSHPLDFASRIQRDLDPVTPLVDIFLAPAMIRSPEAPPRLSPWWFEPRWPAWLVRAEYWLADHIVLDRDLGSNINRLRREYGLAPQRRIMDRWWLSPDMILGMYPHWFSETAPPCLGSWHTCGFPLTVNDVPNELSRVHAGNSVRTDGPDTFDAPYAHRGVDQRPVFFTPGTAHRHAAQFFADAVEACCALQRPAILATTHAAQLPTKLPRSIQAVGYVPLERVLPQCSAIVHHGGIGTTAQAIAAACPQLILPMAFDQFDNADRVVKLGLGGRLLRPNVRRLQQLLTQILNDPQLQLCCDRAAKRIVGPDGAEVAADHIASILAAKSTSPPRSDTLAGQV
jgi:rhamnosyltransferase subunit B